MGPEQSSLAPALPTSGLDRCRGEAIQGTHWRIFSKIPGLYPEMVLAPQPGQPKMSPGGKLSPTEKHRI